MLHYNRTEILDYNSEDLFKLVLDVENYPEFVPWCSASRIIEQSVNGIKAELIVKFKGATYKYVSLIKFKEFELIEIEQFSGPFTHLKSNWHFQELKTNKTKLNLVIDFSFKSPLLNKLSKVFFNVIAKKMSDAFISRAKELYLKI